MDVTTAITEPLGRGLCLPRTLTVLTLLAVCLAYDDTAAQAPVALPDYPGQVMLIKNTLTAVNHGNLTGNYTVLRDLASERFRRRNTAADLATTFAKLRQQKLDLSPILVTEPRLTERPATDQQHRLQLVGYVPTRPQAVRFALIFQQINGGWVIDEISVAVAPTESVVRTQRIPQSAPGVTGRPLPQERSSISPPVFPRIGPAIFLVKHGEFPGKTGISSSVTRNGSRIPQAIRE